MKTKKRKKLGLQTLGSRNPITRQMIAFPRRVIGDKRQEKMARVAREETRV